MNSLDPVLIQHPWDMLEKVRSMKADLTTHETHRNLCQCRGARQHRTSPEVLFTCQDGSEPSRINGGSSMNWTWCWDGWCMPSGIHMNAGMGPKVSL